MIYFIANVSYTMTARNIIISGYSNINVVIDAINSIITSSCLANYIPKYEKPLTYCAKNEE